MKTDKTPLFFKQFNEFMQALPQQRSAAWNHSLLDSYRHFYAIDSDHIDNLASHSLWQSRINDYRIVEQYWQAKASNGKHIILCHGYFDHVALYGRFIRWALNRGYCLHSFDLPGHGLSSGHRGSIQSFDEYSRVLTHISARENYNDYLCVGQSTGCSIILNALLSTATEQHCTPSKVILLAPLVRSLRWPYLRWLYYALHRIIPSIGRAHIRSSHDKAFVEFLRDKDPLQTTRIPLNWLGAMDDWSQKIQAFTPNPNIPCSIIQGTHDATVDFKHNLPEITRCITNSEIHYIDGAFHQLLNESDHYWQQVTSYLDLAIS